MYDAVVIGAGASGLFCAARLIYGSTKLIRENGNFPIPKILVIDGNDRLGKKLSLTGNGRCNLTNINLQKNLYNCDSSDRLNRIIDDFDVSSTMDFFENALGISLTNKEELVYPSTFSSATVTDALRFYLNENNVEFRFSFKANRVTKISDDSFEIASNDDSIKTTRVIFATGGASYPETGSDGSGYRLLLPFCDKSSFVKVVPALVKMTTADNELRSLSGTKAIVSLKLIAKEDRSTNEEILGESEGEMLFTDNGVSGICVMQLSGILSRFAHEHVRYPFLSVNFLNIDSKNAVLEINRRFDMFPSRKVVDALSGLLRRRLLEAVLKKCGMDYNIFVYEMSDKMISNLADTLTDFRIKINSTAGFDSSQVTSGGLKLSLLSDSLELVSQKNIYCCGEILNVDGPCGGYNLQWAWASAAAVANSIVLELIKDK